jgi:hypothetical protein
MASFTWLLSELASWSACGLVSQGVRSEFVEVRKLKSVASQDKKVFSSQATETNSGTHWASYPVGNMIPFSEGKAADL